MTIKLIGLVGFSRSGKDTIADLLVEQHNFVKIDMTESLKNALSTIYSISRPDWDIEDVRTLPQYNLGKKSIREALLYFAESFNKFYSDTWSNAISRKITTLLYYDKKICVSGIRSLEQAKMITDLGGSLIYVYRPSIVPPIVLRLTRRWGANEITRKILQVLSFISPNLKKFCYPGEFNTLKIKNKCNYWVMNTSTIDYIQVQLKALLEE